MQGHDQDKGRRDGVYLLDRVSVTTLTPDSYRDGISTDESKSLDRIQFPAERKNFPQISSKVIELREPGSTHR